MQDHFFEVTSIKAENAEGTQFSAEINGKIVSGLIAGMDGLNGRRFSAIQKAIDEGAAVEPFVPYVPTYAEKRQREYPKIGDQLDAIWKQLNQDRLNGKDLIAEADSLLGDVLAIKAKYPKEAK